MHNRFVTNVGSDPADNRDFYYTPSLGALRPTFVPSWSNSADGLPVEIRDQSTEGTCTGQALAALVDLLRHENLLLQGRAPQEPVEPCSARMLYEMALFHERQEAHRMPSVFTLRAALKGFYNNGVCLDSDWPYEAHNPCGTLDDTRSRAARNISMGAYFRVRPLLNHYHAAINEAGALYVSATIHKGWVIDEVRRVRQGRKEKGVIEPGDDDGGGHAFVVVGYVEDGFLVLNSWGESWGGYRGWPGIGLWLYRDWACCVRDAWVLRLAVPTPNDFAVAVGEQGLYLSDVPLMSSSTPRIEVVGHYAHFDDGEFVRRGGYPSSREDFDVTVERLRLLAEKEPEKYRRVVLWFDGFPGTAKQTFGRISVARRFFKLRRAYPFYVVWAQDLLESATECLEPTFAAARERAGNAAGDRDRFVEGVLGRLGRAIWRDVQRSAALTAEAGASDMLRKLAELRAFAGFSLHLAAEGVGVVLLLSVFERLKEKEPAFWDLLPSGLDSLTLIDPCATLSGIRGSFSAGLSEKTRVVRLSERAGKTRRFGAYSKSWLHLTANAFDAPEADGEPPAYLGMASTDCPWELLELDIPAESGEYRFPEPVSASPEAMKKIFDPVLSK